MSSIPADATGAHAEDTRPGGRARLAGLIQRQGILIALFVLIIFGALRYDNFLSTYNIASVLRYYSMFALIALGMTFVIMTGGIDLSVGAVAALGSVVSALLSPNGVLIAVGGTVLLGLLIGLLNGLIITRLRILPFITTLAMLLAARGLALVFANNKTVGASTEGGFSWLGQGDLLGLPVPAVLTIVLYLIGAGMLKYSRFGRHVLAVGGNEDAALLMGLPVARIKLIVYTASGALAALAGVVLAAQFNTGQPLEGAGWELSAITAVVVGGTLLTGGVGSVSGTLIGTLLLGLIFNILNFENGKGLVSLSASWQTVIRGAFLLVVVLLQSRLTRQRQL